MKLLVSLLLAMVLFSAIVNADVILISPENNAHSSINPQPFVFKVTEHPDNCTLNMDNAAVKTVQGISANTSALIFYELLDNPRTWSVSCSTASGTVSSPSYTVVIDTTAPVVKLQKPVDNGKLNSSAIDLVYLPTDSNLRSCNLRVKINGIWNTLSSNLSTPSAQNNTFSAELIDGKYDWNVICFDKANNSGTALFDRKITVDTTPPSIVSYTPFSVITESSATLTITTNEDATCKYSSSPNSSFAAMSPFDLTELTTHRQFLTGVSDGLNTYYVKCVDMLKNEMSEQKIKLDVHLLATAKVILSSPSPLKAGKIDIRMETSRALIEPPELGYSFDAETPVNVPLTGSGSVWQGTMIVDEAPRERLGKFTFAGKDIYGYKGAIIIEGRTFIIDTMVPSPLGNLRGELSGGYPFLTWNSQDQDINYYQLYRSLTPGINYATAFINVTTSSYLDYSVNDKQTYYYKVVPVDKAGNRGLLSNEVFVTASFGATQTTPTAEAPKEELKPLPPNLVIKVNDAIKNIEATMLTVSDAKSKLGSLSGETKNIAEDLGLSKKVDNANAKLQTISKQLEDLKTSYHTDAEITDKITNANLEMKKAVNKLARSLSIEEQTEFQQTIAKEDVQRAAN